MPRKLKSLKNRYLLNLTLGKYICASDGNWQQFLFDVRLYKVECKCEVPTLAGIVDWVNTRGSGRAAEFNLHSPCTVEEFEIVPRERVEKELKDLADVAR